MKRNSITFISVIAVVVVLMSVCLQSTALAEDKPIKIAIDGKQLNTDVAPFAVNGRVLVPFRAIFEALGATVAWDAESQTAMGCKGRTYIFLQPDNKNALIFLIKPDFQDEITSQNIEQAVESSKAVVLDVPATAKNGRIMVPARFIAESLGAKVDWDGKTSTVRITTPSGGKDTPTAPKNPGTPKDQNVNSKITGEWEFNYNQQSVLSTPAVSASAHMKLTIEEGGTFHSHMETTSMSAGGVTTMEGKYKIEGDLFVIYDAKKSFKPNKYEGNPNSAYADKPVNDLKYKFSYNEKEDILVWSDWSFHRVK